MPTPKDQLAAAAEQLKLWRQIKSHNNSPIPGPLRQQIVALFECFPVGEIQTTLNLSSSLLYRWLKKPGCEIKVAKPAAIPEFVHLPQTEVSESNNLILELTVGNHCQIRLSGDISVGQLDVFTRNIFMYQQEALK